MYDAAYDAQTEEGSDYGSEYDSEEDKDDKDMHKSQPQACSSKEAAKFLVGKKSVAILTGQGVSAPSGVQGIAGQDGILRQQEKKYDDIHERREVLTREMFLK